MCSMNVRRGMVACEYRITSAYLQLYLQTNINITSYSSATPFIPGPGDGASTAVDPDLRRHCPSSTVAVNHIGYLAPFWAFPGHIAARYHIGAYTQHLGYFLPIHC